MEDPANDPKEMLGDENSRVSSSLLSAHAILELTAGTAGAADTNHGDDNPEPKKEGSGDGPSTSTTAEYHHEEAAPPPTSKEQELQRKEQLTEPEFAQAVSDIVAMPIPTSLQRTSSHGGMNTTPAPNNYRLSEKGTLSTSSRGGTTHHNITPGAVTIPGRRGDDGSDATIVVESSLTRQEQAQAQAPPVLAEDASASANSIDGGEIMVTANIVDPHHVQKEVEELLQSERETARQTVLREMADISAEIIDGKSEPDDTNTCRMPTVIIFACLFVALTIGLSVGLTQRTTGSDTSAAQAALFPTSAPSPAPTSSDCHFCYSSTNRGAELTSQVQDEVLNWSVVVASQAPLITCQDAYEKSFELTIWDDLCSKLQADASFKCGCPDFPPVPEDDSTACTLCSSTERPAPVSATDSLELCQDASRWLPLVAFNETQETCDALRRQALGSSCKCIPDQQDEAITTPCIETLDNIVLMETTQVEDESIERTYILCPNTTFQVGEARLGNFGTANAIVGGQLPIVVRSNARVLCGADGSRANNCTIRDGSFGVFLSNGYGVPGSNTQDQVHIQGISFVNVTNPVAIYTVANITIEDCLFEVC
jgi:hypothetical protein